MSAVDTLLFSSCADSPEFAGENVHWLSLNVTTTLTISNNGTDPLHEIGDPDEIRTHNIRLDRAVLYRLSDKVVEARSRVELKASEYESEMLPLHHLATFWLSGRASNPQRPG